MRFVIALLLGVLPCALPARAQEPTVAEGNPAVKRWKASAELSYTDQTGNRTLRLLTGGLKVSHLQKDLFRLDAELQSRYGESDGGVVARNHYGSLAYDLWPARRWSPFLFFTGEHDRFKRIDARVSGGTGAKYTLYRSPENPSEASISLAFLVSHEDFTPTAADPTLDSRTIGRWSLRLRGTQDLPTGVRLHHVSYYQPMVDQMADYLLRSETGARVALVRRLALSVAYQYNRMALPPEGVAPDDRIVRTGLVFDF